ncbi:MAG: radical SAM protein [Bacteroidota bacterium]
MSVELRPLGVNCNIACQYCYQNPQRDAGNLNTTYNLEAMKRAVERIGRPFALFGGEPLLLPLADLESLWAWGYEHFGRNTLQTNGVLIKEEHLHLFRRYKVRVGISIDGPEELNDVRWAGSLEKTRASTQKTEAAINRLCAAGIPVAIIITLHRGNATADKLPKLQAWIKSLEGKGVRFIRLHLLEVDHESIREKYALSDKENVETLLSFARFQKELKHIRLDIFKDMKALLLGDDREAPCVWRACDPYTTAAVQGVEGQGQTSNCGRTNKDGVDFIKAIEPGYERYLALYHSPQKAGGCKGCRFFLMCKGQCPGTAIDGDWRKRTEHCKIWKKLFARLEKQLLAEGREVLSVSPLRKSVERLMLKYWEYGSNPTIYSLLEQIKTEQDNTAPESRGPATKLSTFQRLCWVSEEAERVWAPRLEQIRETLHRLHQEMIVALENNAESPLQSAVQTKEGAAIPMFTNTLLNNLGISLLPKHPHRFDCPQAQAYGAEVFSRIAQPGLDGWLAEILRWPISYTSLYGIAEVKTPVFKLIHEAPYSAEVQRLEHHGTQFPTEGARGVHLPYQVPAKMRLSQSRSFQRGIAHCIS